MRAEEIAEIEFGNFHVPRQRLETTTSILGPFRLHTAALMWYRL